ncbi:hypothetical protein V1511DRAFT_460987 [Dipodascopsis uninucleata]
MNKTDDEGPLSSPHRIDTTARALAEFMYNRGFLEGACSDITVKAFGKEYQFHRIILDRSPFFSMLFSGKWRDSSCNVIDLTFNDDPNITMEAFELVIARLYGKCNPIMETQMALSLLATASFLDVQELVESSVGAILQNLNILEIALILNFACSNNYGAASKSLSDGCVNFLYSEGWTMNLQEWSRIPTLVAAKVIGGNAFFVPTEWDRFLFVAKLINYHLNSSRRGSNVSDETENEEHTDKSNNNSNTTDKENIDNSSNSNICFTTDIKDSSSVTKDRQTSKELDTECESDVDLKPLRELMESGIYYMHFSFEQIQAVDSMRDSSGSRFVSSETLRDAVWSYLSLKQTILKCPKSSTKLNLIELGSLPKPDSNGRVKAYKIPKSDDTLAGIDQSSLCIDNEYTGFGSSVAAGEKDGQEVSWTKFPPYRFSLEFKNISKLKEAKRVYSGTIWYAGSYWNVYIQKVRTKKISMQMGVYLHRARTANYRPAADGSVFVNMVDEMSPASTSTITTTDSDAYGISELEEDLTEFTMEQDVTGIDVISNAATGSRSSVQSSQISTTNSTLSTPSSAGLHVYDVTLPEFLDSRPTVEAYFEIFTPCKKGKHTMNCFSSSPDVFDFSQSWGWKSTTLWTAANQQQNASGSLKFVVILGVV